MEPIFYDSRGQIVQKPQESEVFWRPGAYGILQNEDKQVCLVIPHSSPLMELPGGGVDTHETFIEALEREFYEETRFSIEPISEIPIFISQNLFYRRSKNRFLHNIYLVYGVKLSDKDISHKFLDNQDMDEIAKVVWVEPSTISSKNTSTNSYVVLKAIFNLSE